MSGRLCEREEEPHIWTLDVVIEFAYNCQVEDMGSILCAFMGVTPLGITHLTVQQTCIRGKDFNW